MAKKTLLLDASYSVISFIPERKVFKLLYKEKAEVVSEWEDIVAWGSGKMRHPAILRLKNHVRKNYFNSNFSRKAVVKRDNASCQFCNKKLLASQITIDHVIPRVQGGSTSFTNCVVSCHACNAQKADRTPEQAGMALLRKPIHPSFIAQRYFSDSQEHWHIDWNNFIRESG